MNQSIKSQLDLYTHSRPIIFSHLDNQYPYEIYYNDDEQFGILYTSFDYHFVFGETPKHTDFFTDIILKHVSNSDKDEFIFFAPNPTWMKFLKKTLHKINGIEDKRYLYYLNLSKFKYFDTHNEFVKLEFIQEQNSSIAYPQANIYLHGKLVSYCRAFMIGDGEAELDVWTDEEHRLQGLAFDACLVLIEYLLSKNIKPNWSCWEQKKSSHTLAKKLGFELSQKIKTFVLIRDYIKTK